MWGAVGKDVGDRDLEGDREDVETGEDVLSRWAARAGDAAKIVPVQVDQVEDSLLIELIGVVELAGDDPPAVRKTVNEGVNKRLIVQTDFAARGISRVVTLERTEAVDEPVGLRAVVVREDEKILAEDDGSPVIVVVVPVLALRAHDAGDLHRLGAAGELPE